MIVKEIFNSDTGTHHCIEHDGNEYMFTDYHTTNHKLIVEQKNKINSAIKIVNSVLNSKPNPYQTKKNLYSKP